MCVCVQSERTGTRQNRTTVNGSSLQSSYFLMMAGPSYVRTCVRTQGTRRIESESPLQREPQNRFVPYCPDLRAWLSFVLRHGELLWTFRNNRKTVAVRNSWTTLVGRLIHRDVREGGTLETILEWIDVQRRFYLWNRKMVACCFVNAREWNFIRIHETFRR